MRLLLCVDVNVGDAGFSLHVDDGVGTWHRFHPFTVIIFVVVVVVVVVWFFCCLLCLCFLLYCFLGLPCWQLAWDNVDLPCDAVFSSWVRL